MTALRTAPLEKSTLSHRFFFCSRIGTQLTFKRPHPPLHLTGSHIAFLVLLWLLVAGKSRSLIYLHCECMKFFFPCLILCFKYVHGKQLRSIMLGRTVTYNHFVPGQASRGQFTSIKYTFFRK